ncbi:MAG: RhuM family protein [Humidesulfovibrio sp.]|uniref:RhuM family protein n=1 Tax=Humidesulfovibrio sp. TaxID=2910988 RepID=UPI0027324E14|nr:RhuM family protein [Humidesulfovibrio sp.]MDP2846808.1 RhuM family protein [Humidesulfovibrio sp.]
MATIGKKQGKTAKPLNAPVRPAPRAALPVQGAPDYFDELLVRIREIRASEKRFYRKVTDIYATSRDYNARAPISLVFFATVQNKLHWAVAGQTAAEIVHSRVDASAPNMGLQTWKGDKVCKADVCVAKNYMNEQEIQGLNRIVTMYLDYAEDQAERHREMRMADWATKLDEFLRFNDREVLNHAGSRTHVQAKTKATREYALFKECRRAEKARLVGETRPKLKRQGRGK